MSKFARFMKENKKVRENEKYIPTLSLTDEKGKPLEFEFKHITSREDEEIREECTYEIPVKGKPGVYREKTNVSKYMAKIIAASIVYPDLYDADLQDSYGVKTPEDLILEMIDDPGEYNALGEFVQKFQGFNKSFSEKVEEAKN